MSYCYFLETALSPLEFPDKPDETFERISYLYTENLSEKDLKNFRVLQKYIDVQNIRAFYLDYPLNSKGLLNKNELKNNLEQELYFDEDIYDILNEYETSEEKARAFPRILKVFLDKQIEQTSGFLRWFFEFEKYSRLILCAFRCKHLKRDVIQELSFEDPHDPIVSEIFAQKDSPHFDAPAGYEDLAEVLQVAQGKPKEEYYALYEYRFRMIKEQTVTKSFTLDWLLGYVILFAILEEYHNVNEVDGANILNKMMKDV